MSEQRHLRHSYARNILINTLCSTLRLMDQVYKFGVICLCVPVMSTAVKMSNAKTSQAVVELKGPTVKSIQCFGHTL